jgi:hypothetical protein
VLACDTEIASIVRITREVRLLTEINAAELRGAKCGTGAREQEACSKLGELAEACGVVSDWGRQARCLDNETLLEALGRIQRELDARLAEERMRLRAQRVPS